LKVTLEEIRLIVADNDKQRFSLIPVNEAPAGTEATDPPSGETAAIEFDIDHDDPANYLIRANQGHSIKVAEEGLLEPITLDTDDLPNIVVHGTTLRAWPLIVRSGGLKTMGRTHVHFASGLPEGFRSLDNTEDKKDKQKEPVISGMRSTSSILIYLDIDRALKAGLKFWRSQNGVILGDGNESGIIAAEFFEWVEDRKKGSILMRDGKAV
jgi:2'-phosphotransferase